jgi:hypothetical protein
MSPEEQRRIKKAIEKVDQFWTIDFNNLEIRHKPIISRLKRFFNFFWKKKVTVMELYRWVQSRLADDVGIAYPIAMESDRVPIVGYPRKFRLLNDWSIAKKDLKYIIDGPLSTQDYKTILVDHNVGLGRVKKFLSQYGAIVTTFAATIGIIKWILELLENH